MASDETMWECVARQWDELLSVAGLNQRRSEAMRLLRGLTESWGSRRLDEAPRWSGLTEDASPAEFSLVIGDARPELRVLVEPQADPACPATYWKSGLALTDRLRREWGCDTSAVDELLPAFAPRRPDERVYGCMWHAAAVREDGPPVFRLYVGAQATEVPPQRVCFEALKSFQAERAWTRAASVLTPRDDIMGMAFDLVPKQLANAKVYVRPPLGATVGDVERICETAATYVAGDASRFTKRLFGEGTVSFRRPPVLSLHFTRGNQSGPSKYSVDLSPYPRLESDEAAIHAVHRTLVGYGVNVRDFDACTAALRSVHPAPGLITWLSLRPGNQTPRMTIYLSPRLFVSRHGRVALTPDRTWPSPVRSEGESLRP